MTIRDLYHHVTAATSLKPAVRTNGTANGASVDLRGYDSALVVLSFGTYTDGAHAPVLQHADDNVTFEDVPAAQIQDAFVAVTSAAGQDTVQIAGYKGDRRYLRVAMEVTGATSGAASSATIIAGHPHRTADE